MKYIIAFIVLVLLCAGLVGLLFDVGRSEVEDIMVHSYEECVAAGYPVAESNPPRCITPYGESFEGFIAPMGTTTEPIDPSIKPLILTNLKANDVVESPLTIKGKAPGSWYFEASFPIEIQDDEGNKIGQGYAQADGEWMTPDNVAFTARVTFEAATETGTIVFSKDNPSGLPENDASIELPVRFEISQP
jgi:hypothetical protein